MVKTMGSKDDYRNVIDRLQSQQPSEMGFIKRKKKHYLSPSTVQKMAYNVCFEGWCACIMRDL